MSQTVLHKLKTMPKPVFGMVLGIPALAFAVFASVVIFALFDHINPPVLTPLSDLSVEVVDRDGHLLRAYTSDSGAWRLATDRERIDPEFLAILLAYEDGRFYRHAGVDLLAIMRASWQLITNGRIVSGASTITMQLARLLEPRKKRTFPAKFWQMLRALQLERRLSKKQILNAYLTLAPYGGNLEGIRAASLAYFAKEPGELSLSQAALLVALPQSPESRRPDVAPKRATRARNKVLQRMIPAGLLSPSEVARAVSQPLAAKRGDMPKFAAHAADRIVRTDPNRLQHQTTLARSLQEKLEKVVLDASSRLAPDLSIALVLADGRSGEILAEIGSPDYVSADKSGWIDMSRAVRSPGSALKPFIYGLAFEEGLVRSQTLITDRPMNFGGYRPKNFDMEYQGEVSIRDALLLSLNVPAVALLEAVGPARLMERIRRGGVMPELPNEERAGLAIGLGGIGLNLKDLTQLYTAFVNGGRVRHLHDLPENAPSAELRAPVLDLDANWHIVDILKEARAPSGAAPLPIAYKTGTSYGYRDAWSVGFDGHYILGVWVGRPDNSAVPGITGRNTAAPILFNAFARSGIEFEPFAPAPRGVGTQTLADLPLTLRHFKMHTAELETLSLPEPPPRIAYPPNGVQIELTKLATGKTLPLVLKLQNGRPPFRWLANGEVFATNGHKRSISWTPSGVGQSTLTVLDAAGRADSVSVFMLRP